jgi:hypothetical protein
VRLTLTLIAGLSLATGAAWGAAQPISPTPGEVVRSSHPIFRWSLPANERSQAVYIANKPDTTPDGQFHSENVVDVGVFFEPQDPREWSPSNPLYAGRYWWHVWSSDRSTYDSYYSAPSDFTIPAEARIVGLRVRRYRFLRWLNVEMSWRANVRRPIAEASIFTLRGRRLWSARSTEFGSVGSVGSSDFTWTPARRIRPGTRVRLTLRLRAQGAVASVTRVVHTP